MSQTNEVGSKEILELNPDGSYKGIPSETTVGEDGETRRITLLELAETAPADLTARGWTGEQLEQLERLVAARTNIIAIDTQDGAPRFLTKEDKGFALLSREAVEAELRDAFQQLYKAEFIDELIEDMFSKRTAEEPAVIPKLTMLFGRPIEEFEDGQGDILSAAQDDLDRNWGF